MDASFVIHDKSRNTKYQYQRMHQDLQAKKRMISSKFYFFDIGVAAALQGRDY
jgi:hypothetical protein